jgi:hypothetical protein
LEGIAAWQDDQADDGPGPKAPAFAPGGRDAPLAFDVSRDRRQWPETSMVELMNIRRRAR